MLSVLLKLLCGSIFWLIGLRCVLSLVERSAPVGCHTAWIWQNESASTAAFLIDHCCFSCPMSASLGSVDLIMFQKKGTPRVVPGQFNLELVTCNARLVNRIRSSLSSRSSSYANITVTSQSHEHSRTMSPAPSKNSCGVVPSVIVRLVQCAPLTRERFLAMHCVKSPF